LAQHSLKETAEYLSKQTGVKFSANKVAEIEASAIAKIKAVLEVTMETKRKEMEASIEDEGIDFTLRPGTPGTRCESRRTATPVYTSRSQTTGPR
jgi:hypothetical protein